MIRNVCVRVSFSPPVLSQTLVALSCPTKSFNVEQKLRRSEYFEDFVTLLYSKGETCTNKVGDEKRKRPKPPTVVNRLSCVGDPEVFLPPIGRSS